MDSVDLNINNYNFDELMNIFKINSYDATVDYKSKLDRKVQHIREKYPENIYLFYNKIKLILLVVFSLLDNKYIKKK